MRGAMRSAVIGLLAISVSGACLAQALPPSQEPGPDNKPVLGPQSVKKWVHLHGADDLEHLRATNFRHYLRAQKILAAANEICQPGAAQVFPAGFAAENPKCQSAVWMTSFPPKKLLTFQLDDVGYFALVTVTVSGGRLIGGPLQAQPPAAPR
jgi:hypothetical protein